MSLSTPPITPYKSLYFTPAVRSASQTSGSDSDVEYVGRIHAAGLLAEQGKLSETEMNTLLGI